MYNLLSLVIGAVVAIMIAINGQLTSAYDLFVSAVIIHVIGTVFSLIVCLCRHQKILVKGNIRTSDKMKEQLAKIADALKESEAEDFSGVLSGEDIIALKTILEMLTKTARKKEGEG